MTKRPHNFIDLTGGKFGHLTVIGIEGGVPLRWICKCDCGNTSLVRTGRLTGGETKSCGCLIAQFNRDTKTTHGAFTGGKPTRAYTIWQMMKQRCLNPKAFAFEKYGGRGIKVDPGWMDFAEFLKDMGNPPSQKHTLDRYPDRNGNYEPGNCRWATDKEQNRNSRNNVMLSLHGETKCLSEWIELLGLNSHMVRGRIRFGWDVEKAFTEPKVVDTKGRPGIGRPKRV